MTTQTPNAPALPVVERRGVPVTAEERCAAEAAQAAVNGLRHHYEDCVIVAVGARGPNLDCPEGNAIATVRMGDDEATSEALHLIDALLLARGKILDQRAAKVAKREKEAAARAALARTGEAK